MPYPLDDEAKQFGASSQNRTDITCLEDRHSTFELYLHEGD